MNKLSLIHFFTLALILLPILAHSIVFETGSLYEFLLGEEPACEYDYWVSHISEGIALPGYNDYPRWDRQTNGFGTFTYPDDIQAQNWDVISGYFVNQQWADLDAALVEYDFDYDLVAFTDTDTGRLYYMLRERLGEYYDTNGTETILDDENGSFRLGWGIFIFNPSAISPVIITVPHPNDDYIAPPLAWKVFTQYNARYLFINGAGREVMWNNEGSYNNSKTLSDPSRNPFHPFHFTYMKSCNEIRNLLADSPSVIKKEFSMQTHSYDTNLHIGFPNCQVSAGGGQSCPNLPIRDLSLTMPDMINAAGYIIHPANTIGNNAQVLTNNFFSVNYSVYPFIFNDGTNTFPVSNNVDLPGYGPNNQMQYTIAGTNSYDVYEPFFHIEMDELPDSYPQTDSCLAWFYGYDALSQSWNLRFRYNRVLAYYQPWVDALQSSLNTTLQMNDNTTPATPILNSVTLINNNTLRLNWQRIYEYDFDTWVIALERFQYQTNGSYVLIDTIFVTRNNYTKLADQVTQTIDISGFPLGFHYRVRLAARDKSNRRSAYSEFFSFVTYASSPLVTNLGFRRNMSDESHISIQWTPVAQNILINSYRIDRRVRGASVWETLTNVPQGQATYTDSNFILPDSLVYEYRIVTLGVSGQVYTPTTYCTGYFRCYPAPDVISIEGTSDLITVLWNAITHTKSGHADAPDYYRVIKSAQPDFLSPDTQSFIVFANQLFDAYSPSSPWSMNCFYKITALAMPIAARDEHLEE
jgi:hypothetical protein